VVRLAANFATGAAIAAVFGCSPSHPAAATPQVPEARPQTRAASAAPLRAPDVPFEPSPPEVVTQMLELAEVRPNDVVYDLGCGDGRIVIAAVKRYGARGVGIDIDPVRIRESIENARTAGVSDRTTFLNQDLFEASIAEATVVTLFLWPEVNLKLRPKLLHELRPGTRVVSFWHDMGDWKPDRVVATHVDGESPRIYLWHVPGRAQRALRSR